MRCDRYLVVHSSTAKGNAQAEAGAAVLQGGMLQGQEQDQAAECPLCRDPWEVTFHPHTFPLPYVLWGSPNQLFSTLCGTTKISGSRVPPVLRPGS